MAVAVFDYARWVARYPEFASVSEPAAEDYFLEAGMTLDNTDCSVVENVDQRLMLLNMLVAHIAALSGTFGPSGFVPGTPSGIVGRVSDATEGTVNVKSEMGLMTNASAWYMQTQYGAAYWNATRGFRTMHYRAPPPYDFGPLRGYPWRQ